MSTKNGTTINSSNSTASSVPLEVGVHHHSNVVQKALKLVGPGFITGASDDDPSGIGTYATAGAAFGFNTLWTALLTFPLMAAVQFICAKVGMVSGRGIAGVIREHYSRKVLYLSVFIFPYFRDARGAGHPHKDHH